MVGFASDPTPLRSGRSGPTRLFAATFAVLLAACFGWSPAATASTTWSRNIYVSTALVYQDPYPTACTAATTMIMLNTIAFRHTGGSDFRWTMYRVKNSSNTSDTRDMTSILSFARTHDTLSSRGSGSDPHGWRNALNYYGWGSARMKDPARRVYQTLAYSSYDAATHAAVRAIARFGMPVGIVSLAGKHAQVMTGYVVEGANPVTSDAFTVKYVYLTDPLYLQHHVNYKVSNATFKSGTFALRFQSYREADSPYDDPYAAGWKRSSVLPSVGPSQWYGRWVIVAPVRNGAAAPSPSPSPTPSPTPSDSPSPTPSDSPSPTPSDSPSPTPAPSEPPSSAAPSPSQPAPGSTEP